MLRVVSTLPRPQDSGCLWEGMEGRKWDQGRVKKELNSTFNIAFKKKKKI